MSQMIFPFERLFGDLVVNITAVRIDGQAAPDDVIDRESRTLLIQALKRETWAVADIDVEVEFPIQELLNRGVPESGLSLLLQFECDATDLRATERLALREGKAQGTLSFSRDLVAERARVACVLCATGTDRIPRILKESRPWNARIQEASEPTRERPRRRSRGSLTDFFDVRWRDFLVEDGLKPIAKELYFVDVDSPDRPRLYLNEGIDKYRTLLSEKRATSHEEQALRDLEYRRLALGAWFAAVIHALNSVQVEEDSGDLLLPEDWRRDVLKLMLEQLRPQQPMEVTAREIARARSDGDGYGTTLGELQVAINQIVDTTAVMRRSLMTMGQEN